jgi:cysteine-rich repeat protein
VDITSETEPNDDGMVAVATNDFLAANANGPYTADALIAAAINPAGDDDVFAISNPGPGYIVASIETYGAVPGACDLPLDTHLFLLTAAGVQLAVDDQSGINSCSLLSNIVIPPGITLYARVIDFGDNTLIPAYHVHIRIDPVTCGDALGGPLEQCDDGGNVGGDGCSATCQIEGVVPEVEPNGTSPQADVAGIIINGDVQIGGAIGAIGDLDRFRMELAAPQVVKFETFTTLGQCNNGFATTLRLFDAAGAPIIADTGPLNGSGIGNCAALTFPLPAGTFYVQV